MHIKNKQTTSLEICHTRRRKSGWEDRCKGSSTPQNDKE